MRETIDTAAKYLIALVVIVGCFALIYVSVPGSDNTQPWATIALITGWLIRDSAGNTATRNVERITATAQGAPLPPG